MSGTLIYLMGASGSGKDSLLRYAREHLEHESGLCFAHRYITRPADAGGENHIALSATEFQSRLRARLFALHWQSHDLHYGIGLEINQWLARGLTVVLNGSRAHLAKARQLYPELLPVWVEVSPETLRQRLQQRGREDAGTIERRLQRNQHVPSAASGNAHGTADSHAGTDAATTHTWPSGGHVIVNEGPLDEAGAQLVSLIRSTLPELECA